MCNGVVSGGGGGVKLDSPRIMFGMEENFVFFTQ